MQFLHPVDTIEHSTAAPTTLPVSMESGRISDILLRKPGKKSTYRINLFVES